MYPLVSVVIPCFNEEKYIRSLLANILKQDYPPDRLEVFIVDGMSTDRTPEIIAEYHLQYPNIQLILNEKRFVPFALNLGIQKSRGEVIIRMDAHSVYPENYIRALADSLFKLKADNVGGVWLTKPADNSIKANAIALALSSSFGIGNSLYRLGVNKIQKVDTVPFGCFHRSLFDRIGFFDEELLRNQDDEFNARIIENGGSIYLLPDVAITYYARPDVSSLIRMFFQYAFFKPLVNRKLKKPATLRQFVPPAFVLFLFLCWLSVLISPTLFIVYLSGVGLYLLLNLTVTLKSAITNRKWGLIFYLPWIFFVQHMAYGIGYLKGIITFVIIKKTRTTIITSR